MSLDKAIKHKKEHRKPYTGAKAVDPFCRNHGMCPWCQGKIKYKNEKRKPLILDEELPENRSDTPKHDSL